MKTVMKTLRGEICFKGGEKHIADKYSLSSAFNINLNALENQVYSKNTPENNELIRQLANQVISTMEIIAILDMLGDPDPEFNKMYDSTVEYLRRICYERGIPGWESL